jgi:hypothetical protein
MSYVMASPIAEFLHFCTRPAPLERRRPLELLIRVRRWSLGGP